MHGTQRSVSAVTNSPIALMHASNILCKTSPTTPTALYEPENDRLCTSGLYRIALLERLHKSNAVVAYSAQMPPESLYPMLELLMRYGVEPQQARSLAVSSLRNWELEDAERILRKIKRPSPDYCLFKSDEVKPTRLPRNADDITLHHRWWPTLWAVKSEGISPPREMVQQSAKEGLTLCVNVKGQWSLRTEGYVALSHVWIEGLQREEKYGGLEKTKITKVFELLKRAGLASEWIWTDVLVIPGGGPTACLEDELLTVDLINSMPEVYSRAEAVLIFDALVLQLHSVDLVDVAVGLACGRWATRVWTYQEIKLANKAVVVTAVGSVDFADMVNNLRDLEALDKPRYRDLYLWAGIMGKTDKYRITIRDLVTACNSRRAGVDIDYARAFFPVLNLKWKNGMTREEGMQMIYRSLPQDTAVIASFAGSPRMKLQPAWAPSYLTGLEGVGSDRFRWERRGLRGEWYILKIKRLVDTTRPRYGKIGLNLEVECPINLTVQCIVGPNEYPEVIEAVKTMIGGGYGYILSTTTFATYSKEWARSVLIVGKAITAAYHGLEVSAYCTALIGTPGEHREEKVSVLIRDGNPNVDSDLYNQLHYQWYREEEISKPADLPQEQGESPLHAAVRQGNVNEVVALIENGELVDSFDSRGFTPLHTAAARGAADVLKVLARKTANIEIPCRSGALDTPLIHAARRGQAKSIEILLDNGAQIENTNSGEYTALMSAAYECHHEAVAMLLSRNANPDSRDAGGFSGSALMLASGRNGLGLETMKLLIQHGADINPTFHPAGWTPLLKAADMGNDGEVDYLLSVGAHPNAQDTSKQTPLRHAIHRARENSVRMLLDAGADREAVFDNDLRPVHLAAMCGNYVIMQMLLEEGGKGECSVNVNVRAADSVGGETPLHMAVQKGQVTVVKLLLRRGADVNMKDMSGRVPLDHAISMGSDTLQAILRAPHA